MGWPLTPEGLEGLLVRWHKEHGDKLTEEQKARLERMKGRLDDLLKLIHTWLRVYSVDVNKIKEQFQPVAVSSVIARAVENTLPHATRKNVEIVSTVGDSLPMVSGDAVNLSATLAGALVAFALAR